MAERLNNTIETQINEGNTLITQMTENGQVLQSVIQDVPQVQTVLQNGINVSSQINAPFVEVTSVNGKTGDVITEPVVGVFEPNHYYLESTMIAHNNNLYYAKETFTSGSSFNANDWYSVEGSQITVDSALSTTSENPVQNKVITSALNNKVNSSDLAEVATSGSFTDLINVPVFPTVNNATLTIQKNGTTVNTFTANSSTNKTANITVPTKTSDITNDSGFITGIPTASASTLGGIKVGDGLDITNAGVVSTKLQFTDETSAEDVNWELFINKLYPVGSIYLSTSLDTVAKVQEAFGGTWEAWGSGRVPVGVDTAQTEFNTVNKTGGEKTHTLTITEMPSHAHKVHAGWSAGSLGNNFFRVDSNNPKNQWDDTFPTGGGQAHNNLQPYITCYMYRRIS